MAALSSLTLRVFVGLVNCVGLVDCGEGGGDLAGGWGIDYVSLSRSLPCGDRRTFSFPYKTNQG